MNDATMLLCSESTAERVAHRSLQGEVVDAKLDMTSSMCRLVSQSYSLQAGAADAVA